MRLYSIVSAKNAFICFIIYEKHSLAKEQE